MSNFWDILKGNYSLYPKNNEYGTELANMHANFADTREMSNLGAAVFAHPEGLQETSFDKARIYGVGGPIGQYSRADAAGLNAYDTMKNNFSQHDLLKNVPEGIKDAPMELKPMLNDANYGFSRAGLGTFNRPTINNLRGEAVRDMFTGGSSLNLPSRPMAYNNFVQGGVINRPPPLMESMRDINFMDSNGPTFRALENNNFDFGVDDYWVDDAGEFADLARQEPTMYNSNASDLHFGASQTTRTSSMNSTISDASDLMNDSMMDRFAALKQGSPTATAVENTLAPIKELGTQTEPVTPGNVAKASTDSMANAAGIVVPAMQMMGQFYDSMLAKNVEGKATEIQNETVRQATSNAMGMGLRAQAYNAKAQGDLRAASSSWSSVAGKLGAMSLIGWNKYSTGGVKFNAQEVAPNDTFKTLNTPSGRVDPMTTRGVIEQNMSENGSTNGTESTT
uniref:Uncharacterized protein n=1 Tax=Nuksystermes virus TaxID=2796622 RepID=A0A894KM76_9VIRU|nr:hypothetical protein 1 [Nuksystermes virus]QRW42899.1 hypothetical protein 1 [Nuksystermes virus]